MPANSNLVWVNKNASSSSLSNCKSEKAALHQIRSHAVTSGHKTSRVKRPLTRMRFNLKWTWKPSRTNVDDVDFQSPSPKYERHNILPSLNDLISPTSRRRLPKMAQDRREAYFASRSLSIDALSGLRDPFSAHSIKLDPTTLELFNYFEHVWTQSAFKLPGCIGYGQPPLPQQEISSIVQLSLSNTTQAYCLLAAASARRHYIHTHPNFSSIENRQRHIYAAKALNFLGTQLKLGKQWGEQQATSIIFLAAYEVYCEDEAGAGRHLAALRKLYHRGIKNLFVRRLQANLEILVAKSLEGVGRKV